MKRWSASRSDRTLFGLLTLLAGPAAHAAACCGGGFVSPTLIVGDQRSQLTLSALSSDVAVDNVDAAGYWRRSHEHASAHTLRVEGATLLSDRWQAGMSVPVIRRTHHGETSAGLGDVAATLGYEFLPDWDYNPIRPKGLGYLQLTLPTGRSKYEAELGPLESRGLGFWSVGAGVVLTKAVGDFDLFSSIDVHRSFSKNVTTAIADGKLVPGFGGNFGAGAGYNLASWRLGSTISWTIEEPVALERAIGTIAGAVERYATASLQISYLRSDEWAGTLAYMDQTWFGAPTNTSLARGVSLQLQRRWLR